MELMQASNQWVSRPADERFVSLHDMQDHFDTIRRNSREVIAPSKKLRAAPAPSNGIVITGPNGHAYAPTHHAFGQIATLAGAPAGYLRKLPAPVAADCINYGLQVEREVSDVGILLTRSDAIEPTIRAATGPRYGRIWNGDITRALTDRFGDGVTGEWKVPGEFGKAVSVTKENTTLFAGDRDMFIFLADETNRIEIANRRNGQPGSMARGFFVWNSEVGDKVFGFGTFMFDYVCANRIVWGASEYKEIRIRHTASAPDKFLDQIRPALIDYANSSTLQIENKISMAQQTKIDKLDEFLATRFGNKEVEAIKAAHILEEQRPIETVWDAVTGATAWAKGKTWQDDRVDAERKAGALLDF